MPARQADTPQSPRMQPGHEINPKQNTGPLEQESFGSGWLCVFCFNKITSENSRFLYNDQSEFEFDNPSGNHFHIITFANVPGCSVVGEPTIEHTWFKEHAWSHCMCSKCGKHMGWKYSGKNLFYGLIRTHIVLGSAAMS